LSYLKRDFCLRLVLLCPTKEKKVLFESKLPRITLVSRTEEIATGWTGKHNEELHNLYSTNLVTVMKKILGDSQGH
jgi:hypothetical protein